MLPSLNQREAVRTAVAAGLIALVLLLTVVSMPIFFTANAAPMQDGVGKCPDGSSFTGPVDEVLAFLAARCPQGPAPAAPAVETPAIDTGTLPKATSNFMQGHWEVMTYDRYDESPIVQAWINRLQDPAPELWQVFPNVQNNLVPEFKVVEGPNGPEVPWGAEYGMADAPFCEQDMRCDFVVPAQSYRLITGDYTFMGKNCAGNCMLLLVNVMNKSYTWRNQSVDNGFTVHGRYWDGDNLEWAVWGLVSHASANMLNMQTFARDGEILNAGTGTSSTNAGANCGDAMGCSDVNVRVVIHAGEALVAMLETTVNRDGALPLDGISEQPTAEPQGVAPTNTPAAAAPTTEPATEPVDTINIAAGAVEEIPAGYSVVGDVEMGPTANGPWTKMYDDNGATGLVVSFEKAGWIKAPWGATASNRSAIDLSIELKSGGCGNGCESINVVIVKD